MLQALIQRFEDVSWGEVAAYLNVMFYNNHVECSRFPRIRNASKEGNGRRFMEEVWLKNITLA